MTVLEGIQRSSEFLAKKGVDSPRLHAELLLARVIGLARMQLYLNFERSLSAPETDALRELVKRRGQREPLQHILGSTSFCGYEIAVNSDVLIPRPETELLAEQGWTFLNQLAAAGEPNLNALDLGTGSGCLAIALAAKCHGIKVYASDISVQALDIARENAFRNALTDRIQFLQGDAFAALGPGSNFNLIVSNPPYIPSSEIDTLAPEVRDHDPRLALDGGPDGLDFFRRLGSDAKEFLKSGGKLMLEFGDGEAEAIRAILEAQKWIVEAISEDYTGRLRTLVAHRK